MNDPVPQPSSYPPAPSRRAGTVPWIISLALAAVVGALLFTGGYLAAGGRSSSDCAAPDEAFAAFCEAYDRVQRE